MGSGGQWADGHRAPALWSLPSSLVPAPGVHLGSLRPLWAPESRATWPLPLAPIWGPRASLSSLRPQWGLGALQSPREDWDAPFRGHPGDGGRAGFHLETPDQGGHLACRPVPPSPRPRRRCAGSPRAHTCGPFSAAPPPGRPACVSPACSGSSPSAPPPTSPSSGPAAPAGPSLGRPAAGARGNPRPGPPRLVPGTQGGAPPPRPGPGLTQARPLLPGLLAEEPLEQQAEVAEDDEGRGQRGALVVLHDEVHALRPPERVGVALHRLERGAGRGGRAGVWAWPGRACGRGQGPSPAPGAPPPSCLTSPISLCGVSSGASFIWGLPCPPLPRTSPQLGVRAVGQGLGEAPPPPPCAEPPPRPRLQPGVWGPPTSGPLPPRAPGWGACTRMG